MKNSKEYSQKIGKFYRLLKRKYAKPKKILTIIIIICILSTFVIAFIKVLTKGIIYKMYTEGTQLIKNTDKTKNTILFNIIVNNP